MSFLSPVGTRLCLPAEGPAGTCGLCCLPELHTLGWPHARPPACTVVAPGPVLLRQRTGVHLFSQGIALPLSPRPQVRAFPRGSRCRAHFCCWLGAWAEALMVGLSAPRSPLTTGPAPVAAELPQAAPRGLSPLCQAFPHESLALLLGPRPSASSTRQELPVDQESVTLRKPGYPRN